MNFMNLVGEVPQVSIPRRSGLGSHAVLQGNSLVFPLE